MGPIKDLVLAVDFSDHSNITFRSAINFCKESNCTLSLIHVIAGIKENLDEHTKTCNEKIDKMVMYLLREKIVVPHVRVVSGNVEDHVIVFAELINADAIVIGSGNYFNKKYRLGGHAEAILRQSSRPVLIIKNNMLPIKGKIACPIDLLPTSENALKIAIDYTKFVGGELVIIYAVEPSFYGYAGVGLDVAYGDLSFIKDESAELDAYLKPFDFKGITWSKKILLGAPAHQVSEYIKKYPFVMTVMSSAARTGISKLILGSVAETVTRCIDGPCLILKKNN